MTYSEKLKDPRWQKKRLKIMERDGFACKECGSKDKTLNVHHIKYSKNPWDINNDFLITVCEDCHEKIKIKTDLLNDCIARQLLNENNLDSIEERLQEMIDICWFIPCSHAPFGIPEDFANATIQKIITGVHLSGISEEYDRKSK